MCWPTIQNHRFSGWLGGKTEAVQELDELLAFAGYDWQVVEAEALSCRLDEFERFNKMIAQADARRDVVLREIERRRDTVARRMGEALIDVEDAEVEDAEFEDAGQTDFDRAHQGLCRLAALLAGDRTEGERLELARRAAEAVVDLSRVRRARTAVIQRATAETSDMSPADLVAERLPEIVRLDRYERRALSRRKSAIRALDCF